jgi:hypothetical protein
VKAGGHEKINFSCLLTWCHNDQNNVLVVYGALGDSVDLTKDVIFKLRIVVGLNMCVGVCVCGGFACVRTCSGTTPVPSEEA